MSFQVNPQRRCAFQEQVDGESVQRFALFTDKRAVKDDPDLEDAYTLLVCEVLPLSPGPGGIIRGTRIGYMNSDFTELRREPQTPVSCTSQRT